MVKKKFSDKQKKILDVAEELIATKGFDATSVRDICSKAGINVAMISYYFGSKEKMMTFLYQQLHCWFTFQIQLLPWFCNAGDSC